MCHRQAAREPGAEVTPYIPTEVLVLLAMWGALRAAIDIGRAAASMRGGL